MEDEFERAGRCQYTRGSLQKVGAELHLCVSSGEIELLSFAGWIILNDFDGGLLVIDEPELHLHPQWQKQMLPALRELAPNAQFIVASHSDAIWDQAYSFERFLLVGEDDPRSMNVDDRVIRAAE